MSIQTAFNAAIAIVDGRVKEGQEMLLPFLGDGELGNTSDIQHLSARLEQSVQDRIVQESHDMLRNLLREELMQSAEGIQTMTIGELRAYMYGRSDAIQSFEQKWQDLGSQLKPSPEYEPVDPE